jgi:Protein of unknown function (DUF3551)
MKAISKVAIVAASLAAGTMFGAPAALASGDAPWCIVSQIGEGAEAWDCQYETVQECAQNIIGGNRGNCSPNPYAPAAATSVPSQKPVSATSGAVATRKPKDKAKQ